MGGLRIRIQAGALHGPQRIFRSAGACKASGWFGRPGLRPVTKVKLHMGHFAFMRSVLEGLALRQRREHHMLMHGAVSNVHPVRRLRADVTAIVRGHNRHGLASLLDLDIFRISQLVPQLPRQSFETFAIEQD